MSVGYNTNGVFLKGFNIVQIIWNRPFFVFFVILNMLIRSFLRFSLVVFGDCMFFLYEWFNIAIV
jgi:hypothetical protein